LVVLDPPDVADASASGIMGKRYGTVRGTATLRDLIEAGCGEAWRIAAVGVLVKVADHTHQGEHQALSDWVKSVVPMPLYFDLHSYRPGYLRDGTHRVARVPRNHGATYLALWTVPHAERCVRRCPGSKCEKPSDLLMELQRPREENEASQLVVSSPNWLQRRSQ
jgi:hypothetical protein